MSSQVPIDTNAKVTKYLANLNYSQACRNVGSSHINTAALQTLRGPGQAAQDPLQFVSTSAVSLAENARKLISITEQQKRERAKLARNGPQFDNNESWQEDLDTWRRKRKTKVSKQDCSTIGSTSKDYTKDYHSLPNYGRSHKDAKEEILTITSLSHHEDQNDSGIENRTTDSHSPSTSLDFSPRSDSKLSADRSISSKVATSYSTIESSALPDYVPPPPPPSPPPPLSSDSAALDQVLVPLIVSRTISATQQKPDNDDYPPPPRHLQRFGWRAQAVTSRQIEDSKVETPTVDLTVELNREQRGQVTAVRYPTTREIETVPSPVDDHKEVSLISRISHHDQPPPHRSLLRIISAKSSSLQSRHRGMPPTTVYRAVDIPFDESSAVYQPKKDENVTIVKVVMGAHPVEKGFGFSIAINRGRPTIETVIVGTPADRAGLLIGDRVIAINGQHLKDKHLSAINRLLHDAARLGEAEVCIEKRNAKIAHVKSVSSLENFDKARSVFVEKSMDSYAEFKRNHRAPRSNQQFVPEFSSLPRSISTGSLPTTKRENSALGAQLFKTPQCYENTSNVRSENKTYSSNKVTPDYRVMSMHEKADPGRLTDFVPESERNVVRTTAEEKTDEEPRLIRYYDLPPTTPSPKHASSANVKHTSLTSSRHLEDQAVNAIPKRSTLPRNLHGETRTQHDDELLSEKSYLESRDWRDIISQQRQAAPGRPRDTQRIRDASSSLGNLPAIINRKLEETRKLEKEQTQMTEYGFCPTVENGYRDIDNYERSSNRGPFEKSYSSEYHNRQYDSLRYDHHETRGDALAADASLKSEYCRRELSPSADYSKRETNAASREDARRESINNNGQVVAVSGKHRCAHCTDELGRGAAMIIESLNLFYHLACFKCYVCKAKLGSGATGADVRVREGRLHCQSCYSNDRMQLSKV